MKPKFRAWDKEKNKMFEPTYRAYAGELEDLLISLKGDLILRKIDETIHESLFPDRFVLMQYTGKKDKNGLEIYEGDVVKGNHYSRGVGWFDTGEGYYDILGNIKREDFYTSFRINGFDLAEVALDVEVIGNIYEKPELLEEQNK